MNNEEISSSERTPKSLSSLLRQERKGHNWSQSELAQHLGTDQVSISRWENGTVTPGPYFRRQLEKLFGKAFEDTNFFITSTNNEEVEISTTSATLSHLPNLFLWNVPYRRNQFFTGRDEILTNLYTTLNSSKSVALTQAQAISGLGGIGKTQIAVEYAYRYHDKYQAILWVTASSYDTLLTNFVMLAAVLDLPEQKEQDQGIVVRAVKRWLVTHERWLLVLDNVEDPVMVADFLPTQGGTGSFLLTTRLQSVSSIAQSIKVEKMEVDEGVIFLLRRTNTVTLDKPLSEQPEDNRHQAREIVLLLDGLPLALDQAGAYIEETQCSFSTYLDIYNTHRKELLQRRGRLPIHHPEPVAATWSLSFEQIEQESLVAADLLRLLAFLGPDAIPEEIITEGAAELGPTLNPIASDSLGLNAAIELLLRYSLLRRDAKAKLLSIHRLVQAVLKDGMEKEQQRLWAERAIRAINKAFPEVELKTWAQCQRCLPHAQIAAEYVTEYEFAFPGAARLLNQAANYLSTHAQYVQAETLLKQALAIREQVLPTNHPDIASTKSDLGLLYLTQGKYQQAEPLLEHALAICDQALGREYPDTAASLNNLALLYYAQGKYALAGNLYRQALHIRERVLEPEHPDIAQSLNNLAEFHTMQGEYKQAEDLYLRAQETQERVLGPEHLDVARTLNNRALLYRSKGEYQKAEKFYTQALSIQEQRLGSRHPDVAQTLNNIARLYRAQGAYMKAEPFYQCALDIREEVFGPVHPHVAQSLYGLTKLYNSQWKYHRAEKLGVRVLEIQVQCLGNEHLDVAYTLGVVAKAYQGQQKFVEAEEMNIRALRIQEHILDANHPRIALINNNLVEIYHAQGRYHEAEPLIAKSLEIHARIYGPDHPYIAYSLSNRAENLFLRGLYTEAKAVFLQVLAIREKNLGLHARTASTYHRLAMLSFSTHCYDEAEKFHQMALAIRKQVLGHEHLAVATSLEQYAILLHEVGREQQAQEFEAHAQAIRIKHDTRTE
ncbi:MAG: hypothetical protein PVS3B3_28650 [Ktedonobacteraceae bacterium]